MLTKPVDSQLLASVREFRLWRLTDVVVGLMVIGLGPRRPLDDVGLAEVLCFVLTLFVGDAC